MNEKRWHRFLRADWYRDVWTLLLTIVVLAAVLSFQHESADHRDQLCLHDERQQGYAVDRLRSTYGYLVELTAAQRREPVNQLVLRTLPGLEREARERVPGFCNEDDVGLPEPDPVIPERPAGIG